MNEPVGEPAGWRRLGTSLRSRNFRLFFTGQLLSVIGMWLQQIAETWFVFQLTGSPTLAGVVAAARFVPVLGLGLWGGVIADRYPKRSILYVTQSIRAIAAAVVGFAALWGSASAELVIGFAVVAGIANAIDNPTRRSFISELVPKEHVLNAVSLNSSIMAIGRVVAPLLAGVIITAAGVEWCFLINAVSYLAVLIALFLMDGSQIRHQGQAGRSPRAVRSALSYAHQNTEIFVPLVLVATVSAFAWNWEALLAVHADQTFGGEANTYGLLFAAVSFGTFLGAVGNAARRSVSLVSVVRTTLAVAICTIVVAAIPGLAPTIASLVIAGLMAAVFTTASNAFLQVNSAPELHGRVMAIYSMLFVGTKGVGSVIAGGIAELANARWGIASGGIACLVVGLWATHRIHPLAKAPDS